MTPRLRFTVYGRPLPAGSKRAFAIRKGGELTGRVAVADANPAQKGWQQAVASEAREAANGRVIEKGKPVMLRVTFVLARPKAHYGTGRNASVLKDSAPAYPTGKPDTLKLTRAIEDAITAAGVWHDDAQVVWQEALKVYGFPERAEVETWEAAA